MALLGANKSATKQRLNDEKTAYADFGDALPCRFEPLKQRDAKGYRIRAASCAFELQSEQTDLKSSDRLVIASRSFVVAGMNKFDETHGKHLEVLMREVASGIHVEVIRKVLKAAAEQANYDPIFKEWNKGAKTYEADIALQVLLDPAEKAKEEYVLLKDAGKFNNIEWLMTVDLPAALTTDDRITYDSVTYKIEWIEKFPWQWLVGLSTDLNSAPTSA